MPTIVSLYNDLNELEDGKPGFKEITKSRKKIRE